MGANIVKLGEQTPLAAAEPERPFREAVLAEAKARKGDKRRGVEAMAAKLFDAAEEGNLGAIAQIREMIDGKPTKLAVGKGENEIVIVLKSFPA